ncbi:hypothetical protein VNO77_02728 [Canavalia gladiata]|uniref:Uncharacterized protein n=1 Tax=Canavalia gladiata TaxID=3824 RepID=A0AAN9MTP5_CANGL
MLRPRFHSYVDDGFSAPCLTFQLGGSNVPRIGIREHPTTLRALLAFLHMYYLFMLVVPSMVTVQENIVVVGILNMLRHECHVHSNDGIWGNSKTLVRITTQDKHRVMVGLGDVSSFLMNLSLINIQTTVILSCLAKRTWHYLMFPYACMLLALWGVVHFMVLGLVDVKDDGGFSCNACHSILDLHCLVIMVDANSTYTLMLHDNLLDRTTLEQCIIQISSLSTFDGRVVAYHGGDG